MRQFECYLSAVFASLKQIIVVKFLYDTRWPARAYAVKMMTSDYTRKNKTVLDNLSVDKHLNTEAEYEALTLVKKQGTLKTVILQGIL